MSESNMPKQIVEKLFTSFSDLEHAIASAKETLLAKGDIPENVFKRLQSYDGILAKQKNLARHLCVHMTSGNWVEVSRHVNLINGLSAMIRDDARAILSALSLNSDLEPAEDEANFC